MTSEEFRAYREQYRQDTERLLATIAELNARLHRAGNALAVPEAGPRAREWWETKARLEAALSEWNELELGSVTALRES